jgi:hypothetical protein
MIRRQFVSDLNPKQVRSKQLGFKGSQASDSDNTKHSLFHVPVVPHEVVIAWLTFKHIFPRILQSV